MKGRELFSILIDDKSKKFCIDAFLLEVLLLATFGANLGTIEKRAAKQWFQK